MTGRNTLRLLVALTLTAAQGQAVFAQDAATAGDGAATQLEEVQVVGRQRSAATEVLVERIDQPVVTDLLGAEQISRVGDSTVALALRRLPGVTLVGDFVYIRGLGERYSSTTLNGAYVPSPDLTRNVLPLDIFPAEIIESLSIQKGYTVDRPAAFGGGNVDIRTRRIPDRFEIKFGVGSGWNSDHSNDVLSYAGGGDDEFGTDDGTRALPREIRDAIQTYRGSLTPAAIFDTLRMAGGTPTFTEAEAINRGLATSLYRELDVKSKSPAPDASVKASVGNRWTLDDEGRWSFGVQALGDYSSSWRNRNRINRSAQLPDIDNGLTERSVHQVAITGSLSAGLDFTEDHSLGMVALYLRNTDDETSLTQRNNFNFRREQGAQLRDYRLRFEERELEMLQFRGEHALGADTFEMLPFLRAIRPAAFFDGLQFSWYWSDSTARTDIPNEVTVSAVDVVNPATGEVLGTSVRSTTSAADFRFTELEDQVTSYGGAFRRPFELPGGNLTGALSAGWDYYEKGRGYVQTQLALGTTASTAMGILAGTPGSVFTDAHILDPANGFLLSIGGIGTESYLAGEVIDAAWGAIDLTWKDTWRMTAGVRWEDWKQLSVPVDTLQFDPAIGKIPLTAEQLAQAGKAVDDHYPAFALTYMRPDFWAEQFQLRLGWSLTTARPDLREVANSTYIDPFTDARVVGNPALVPSDIMNVDLRAEWFFDGGDNFTISPFYKTIDRPIETIEGAGTDNNLSFTFINGDTADLYGVEVEWFKNLAFVSRWLGQWSSGLFTAGNVTWSSSELTVGSNTVSLTNDVRPLNQQSDLILNLQLGYDAPGGLYSAVVVYNSYSERLFYAGRNGAPDAYEQPFNSLDFVFSLYPSERLSLKLRLQNLLDDSIEIEQGGVIVLGQELGTTAKLDLSYRF
ncbi:MAG: TonB-dependent receptor plug domain-containing protein [Steroidobacteraceae bacterium]|nr:TonB-dependent receptor plug domain-containing protein [Steroidobacteraceae bacterium]